MNLFLDLLRHLYLDEWIGSWISRDFMLRVKEACKCERFTFQCYVIETVSKILRVTML